MSYESLLSRYEGHQHKDEYWESVHGFPGYEISTYGNGRSLDRRVRYNCKGKTAWRNIPGVNLKPWKIKTHTDYLIYFAFSLWKNGKTKKVLVHRLVAQAFLPNPKNYPTVNHKDGNTQNNRIENLEWASHSMQVIHAYAVLGRKKAWLGIKASNHPHAKPVFQIDLATGSIIKRWLSIKDARDFIPHASKISDVCHGKRNKAAGFGWRWA